MLLIQEEERETTLFVFVFCDAVKNIKRKMLFFILHQDQSTRITKIESHFIEIGILYLECTPKCTPKCTLKCT